MSKEALEKYYIDRGFGEAAALAALGAVGDLETHLSCKGLDTQSAAVAEIRLYIDLLIPDGHNTEDRLLALSRYFYFAQRSEIYVYFTSLLGGVGVIETITERVACLHGRQKADAILNDIVRPPLGSEPTYYPPFTARFMDRLERQLSEEQAKKALSGNNHGLPKQAFLKEKDIFESSPDIDEYLKGYHDRRVSELQQHCDSGTVWWEQRITQPVVDYVASNQEILSAVRRGDMLYVTKIPYDPDSFLKETDPKLKRYYACHCPFAREAILTGEYISPNWCYCSAGFAKFPFEVILGRSLDVQLLECALKGDNICRFEISLT